MATLISEACIACGACLPECPNDAIFEGEDLYFIEPERCTECVTFFGEEQCAKVCPVDVCLPDPDFRESEQALIAKAQALHPGRDLPNPIPSHFNPHPPKHKGDHNDI